MGPAAPERKKNTVKLAAYSDGPQMRDFLKGQIWGTIPQLTPSTITNPDDTNRTIVITGANSGLGLEAAKQLVRLGVVKKLILACRSTERGQKAKDEILGLLHNSKMNVEVHVWKLDMASRASIRAFVERSERELDRIDAVILNAGVDLTYYERASQEDGGHEMTLMVNVVGTIVMAALFVPVLRTKRAPALAPRITIVGSAVQFAADYQTVVDAASGHRGEGILSWLSDDNRWSGNINQGRYFLSKGLLQMLVRQLAGKMTASARKSEEADVILNCVNPGWCRTELFRHSENFGSRFGLRLIGRDAEVGARALTVGTVGTGGDEKSHGGYMSEGKVKRCCAWFETEQGERIAGELWQEVSRDIDATQPGLLAAL